MLNRFLAQPWLRHVAVAVGYGLGYALFREAVHWHWMISIGFRLTALMLVPYRYWAGLATGEMASMVYLAVTCADSFGMTWAIFRVIPLIGPAMPVVYICRERLHLFSTRGAINVTVLIFCALAVTLITVPFELGLLSLARRPAGYPSLREWIFPYFIVNYLGILTVTPLVMSIREAISGSDLRTIKRHVAESRLLIEGAGMLLPALGFLVWIGWTAAPGSDTRHIAQMAMFLPVVALALRHGWYGAAIGGTAASMAILALMPTLYDHNTLQAQALIAFAISTMLLMGKHITVLQQKERSERVELSMTLALAQRNFYEGERQLRRAAYVLLDIQRTCYRLLQGGMNLSPVDSVRYERLARPVVHQIGRLTDHLHPLRGSERSLPVAIRDSAMAKVLAEHHVGLHIEFRGGVSELPADLHLALYRLIANAVGYVCLQHPCSDIAIRIVCRGGRHHRWIRLHVEGGRQQDHPPRRPPWSELVSHLERVSRSGDVQAIQDTARTFGGRAHIRVFDRATHVTALLRQSVERGDMA